MSTIATEYECDLALLSNFSLYEKNIESFEQKVEQFDRHALRAYIILIVHHKGQQNETPQRLLELFLPHTFFAKLNEANRLLANENQLSKYLVDAFEVVAYTTKCIEDETFFECYHKFLRTAVDSERTDVISVYLQLLHRIDRVFKTQIPVEILNTIIESVHGPLCDNPKLLNEALMLIESNIEKRHQCEGQSPATEQLLNFMWNNLCVRGPPKHQCNNCYNIIAQLIKVYLNECRRNEQFRTAFLSNELWHFIRAAIESKDMLRRKQAIYILQNTLALNQQAVMSVGEFSSELEKDCAQSWENYFAILESLLEIQCNLIVSCLDQYLDGIAENLPPFWYSIVFALVLKHHNNVVIHYGIEFILRHRISFHHDNNLMNGFYQALNNTYLHSEAKISVQNLAKYFQESDMNHTLEIMMLISWHPVPLWTIVKSIDVYMHENQGMGFQTNLLLEFIKRSVNVIKNLPTGDDIALSILKKLGINNLNLEQVLNLYQIINRQEILDEFHQPLDVRNFESFIKFNQISIDTKIKYFEHAIPNAKDQDNILVEFYENNRTRIALFPHYEYLRINLTFTEKPVRMAFLVTTPGIYDFMKQYGECTLNGLLFAASILKFIALKFINDSTETAVYECLHKFLTNILELKRKKRNTDQDDARKQQQIKDELTVINMKLTKCTELFQNKMIVLGILSDAIMLEDADIDLSRFDPNDENDVKIMQGLYESFIDRSYDLKQSHQANVISKVLSYFHRLELDLWSAYQILVAEKRDIDCIFQQKHPNSISAMTQIYVDALIYGNELKGEEKQAYDFVASKSSSMTYNQKVRITAMRAIAANLPSDEISTLKHRLFAKNKEIYRVRYYTNSHHHSMKLRITQALAFLFRLDPKWDDRMLKIILEEANQTNVTHINELIIAETIEPTQMLHMIENIDGNKGLQSMFMVVYYVCCKQLANIQFARTCIEFLIRYVFMKQIIVRTSAQIVLIKLCEKFALIDEFKVLYDSIAMAHSTKVSRALKFSYAYKYRFDQIKTNCFLHSTYIMREIPRITKMRSDEYYMHENYEPVETSMDIQMDEEECLNVQDGIEVELGFIDNAEDMMISTFNGGNVQRKLVTYRETFIDRQVLNSLSDEFTRRQKKSESELIVMGSLLSKAVNLGGLSRSGEVFGVKAITMDNLKTMKQNEFTSVSMASEKWVKFFEVKHYNIINYLMAMKANGYAIVGAEQTAFGRELNHTDLPHKMILVLGHEKSGIPADILNLLDMAVEIPQLGVVRSLNVAAAASLFMWEYCKRHLITDRDITDVHK